MAKSKPTALRRPKRSPHTAPPPLPLTLVEREKVRGFLADPAMGRALEFIQTMRPSAFVVNDSAGMGGAVKDPAASMASANNRLHEMRGWDQYENALFASVQEAKPRPEMPVENYPDSGRLDHAK
jgi:hypothetical protein